MISLKWFDKIFSREDKAEMPIPFSSIDAWLEEKTRAWFDLRTQARGLHREIEETLDKLEKSVSELEEAEPEGRLPMRLVKAGCDNRDKLVKQLRALLGKTRIPDNTDYETILGFHRNTSQNIRSFLENTRKSQQYSKALFLGETKQVISGIRSLSSLLEKLVEPIREREEEIGALAQAKDKIKRIRDISARLENEKKIEDELKIRLFSREKALRDSENRLRELKEGEEWGRWKLEEEELQALKIELVRLEGDITSLFSPLNKALDRLRKQCDSGRYTLKPEFREVLNQLLIEPVRAGEVGAFLEELKKLVEGDILKLTPGKQDKTLEQIDYLLKTNTFASSKKKHGEIQKKVMLLEDSLSRSMVKKDISRIEGEISSGGEEVSGIKKDIESSQKRIRDLEQELASTRISLEDSLSRVAGKKIALAY